MNSFTSIRRAEPGDTTDIMRLLVNTADWLLSKGSSQWNGLLRGEDSHNTPEAINRGDVFIFKQEDQTAGIVMLLRNPSAWDLELWHDRLDQPAIYLHRLATNREFAGQGVGKRIMQWVDTEVPTWGSNLVRLDCIANNQALNSFYSSLGYERLGTAKNNLGEFSKFEKQV
ncbi:GNAT family N-acetyltransferase [Cohnella lupini]|uniref:Acetyltransferase (GNAT) family protein n=1 Tax=Cohnella lupini TaxID=1294267 RepID=A0A3D9IX10_9BACL|nr:GNAT family N-acetyltransferase [Cohnella lupini]RED66251.1 acetyltransferase (GNAT) family protein [Cohnella lupini]